MTQLFAGLAAAAFLGAGLFNMIGTTANRSNFVRWGYPAWWRLVARVLEKGVFF
jgi:hypothetical protein